MLFEGEISKNNLLNDKLSNCDIKESKTDDKFFSDNDKNNTKNGSELNCFSFKNAKEDNIKTKNSFKLASKTNYTEIIKNAKEKSLKDEKDYKKVHSDNINNKIF